MSIWQSYVDSSALDWHPDSQLKDLKRQNNGQVTHIHLATCCGRCCWKLKAIKRAKVCVYKSVWVRMYMLLAAAETKRQPTYSTGCINQKATSDKLNVLPTWLIYTYLCVCVWECFTDKHLFGGLPNHYSSSLSGREDLDYLWLDGTLSRLRKCLIDTFKSKFSNNSLIIDFCDLFTLCIC